jgi:nucleotide-binding universal stress UspA family protein
MLAEGPILVPLDGSELAEGALPYAAAMARGLDERLILLTVWEGTESELGQNFPAMALEIEQNAREHFTQYLEAARKKLGDGLRVETVVRSGDASDEIIKTLGETGARMTVIATHGRSGIGRWVYGSTAGHLLRESPVPVLAVGPNALQRAGGPVELKHIMAPLDGSEVSESVLPLVTWLAGKLGARVSLVRVVRWAVQAYPYSLPDAYVPQVDEELEAGAKAYLQRKRDALSGVDADAFVVRGAIADGLLDVEEQQGIDLVVMTTHARAGLARMALGSVADRVLQGRSPVLLVRPEIAERRT